MGFPIPFLCIPSPPSTGDALRRWSGSDEHPLFVYNKQKCKDEVF